MGVAESVLSKRDHRHNDLTTDLDVAIRLLNRAHQHEKYARYGHATIDRDRAGRILERFTEHLQIDPEVA